MRWVIDVIEEGIETQELYTYIFDTWAKVVAKLSELDGLAMEYSITHAIEKVSN